MIVRRFFEPLLAQVSYLIGCTSSHEAIVIDPHRDADVYIRAAAQDNVRITYVTETHIHADFLSGTRELATRSGATMLLSGEGGDDWQYAFASDATVVRNGDRIDLGKVKIDVVHTPGHTPEHLTFFVTDGAVADAPIAAATGDFVFVGDVGRPDLLEKAANIKGTMEASARTLFTSLRAFGRHEEWLQIWPGHGAGSACGKGISAVPYSTLGYERRFNWAFKATSEDDFVAKVLSGQPDPPKYFATMKRLNKRGPRVVGAWRMPKRHQDDALTSIAASGALIVDARPANEYGANFLRGTLNIPLNSSFVTWAGWLVPYADDLYLLVGDGPETRLEETVRALSLIGLDRIAGYFTASALDNLPFAQLGRIPQLAPTDAARSARSDRAVILDVRSDMEWEKSHLDGATHIFLGELSDRLGELPTDRPIVTQCQSGGRSAIAASVLTRAGFRNVSNLTGGLDAWAAEGLATVGRSDEVQRSTFNVQS